jgi:hypothetical protein
MKFTTMDGIPVLELTRRNLQALLDKLDDPKSQRMLIDPDSTIAVRAVEDAEHYSDRRPGTIYMPTTNKYR